VQNCCVAVAVICPKQGAEDGNATTRRFQLNVRDGGSRAPLPDLGASVDNQLARILLNVPPIRHYVGFNSSELYL
jgi:hypothetical protein